MPAATMTGPSAAYLVHAGNAAKAAGVGELGTKPDLGPIIKEFIIYPQKVAGLVIEDGVEEPQDEPKAVALEICDASICELVEDLGRGWTLTG
jgi:hypothetical protein